MWIGAGDHQLYKAVIASNAPSFTNVSEIASGDARQKSADAKRIADVRQIASALELYYNDHGGYPASADGSPINLSPTYIGQLPTAPTASGICNDYYNTYWYTAKEGAKKSLINDEQVFNSYTFTFCLGGQTGGYEAGIGTLSPSGIQTTGVCPETEPTCLLPAEDTVDISESIDNVNFSASFRFSLEYSGYGIIKSVEAPSESQDLKSIFQPVLDNF